MGSGPHSLTLRGRVVQALRPIRGGAPRHRCSLFVTLFVVGFSVLLSGGASAQLPDSVQVVDTLAVKADSSAFPPDTIPAVDTIPSIPFRPRAGFETGVWDFDREEMWTRRALTLAELVAEVPGVIALRGGDFGTPQSVSSYGAVGGRVRVFWDGVDWSPLDGATPDLSRIGLGGVSRVIVEQRGDELRIHIFSSDALDPKPQTSLEIATGDLRTNVFRGEVVHPTAFGGAIALSIDRIDTQGPGFDAAGSLTGVTARYVRQFGRGGIIAEVRRFDAGTDVEVFPGSNERSDWAIRGRWALSDALLLATEFGRSSVKSSGETGVFTPVDTDRRQVGARLAWDVPQAWARVGVRSLGGDGLPNTVLSGELGLRSDALGSVDGEVLQESWDGRSVNSFRLRASTRPVAGVTLFASFEDGTRGVPFVQGLESVAHLRDSIDSSFPGITRIDSIGQPIALPVLPTARFTYRKSFRMGASISARGVNLKGAILSVEADSLHPTGLRLDRGGLVLPGSKRTGFEGGLAFPLRYGFGLDGTYRRWDEESVYLPKQLWEGALTYHGIFKESRNLEVWGRLGVQGHDPLLLPIETATSAPGAIELTRMNQFKEWFGLIQVRVVTVRIFVRLENFRADTNLDFPGLEQPRTRTLFGVRWALGN